MKLVPTIDFRCLIALCWQFGNIKFDSISPAIGIAQPDKKYTPMSRGAEYLFDDDEKERSFGEHIQYYCGTSYLAGKIK
jgi:hypothetical protein